MFPQVESKTLKRVTELTHIAPIRTGFVRALPIVTYSTRLKLLLGALFKLRKYRTAAFDSPLDRLKIVHFARWVVLDEQRLLFTSNFDGSWQGYIARFVSEIPALLDLIWSHCDGYENEARSYDSFSRWVARHQVETAVLYASHPELTVLDIDYLSALKRRYDSFSSEVDAPLVRLRSAERALAEALRESKDGTQSAAERLLSASQELARTVDELRAQVAGIRVPETNSNALPEAGWQVFASLRPYFDGPERTLFDRAVAEFANVDQETAAARIGGVVHIEKAPTRPPAQDPPKVNACDVQGFVLDSYRSLPVGRALLVRIEEPDAARDWLLAIAPKVTPARGANTEQRALNVAFTAAGIRALLPPEVLARFPQEFRAGMSQRADVLGDGGSFHPDLWQPPCDLAAVDLVLFLYGESRAVLADLEQSLCIAAEHGVVQEAAVELQRRPGSKEHFGFADGISQPRIAGIDGDAPDALPPGEFLLGYPDASGATSGAELPMELARGGTFMAVRQYAQDREAFARLVEQSSARLGVPGAEFAAKLMGRQLNGDSLIQASSPNSQNDFDFRDDAAGRRCPLHSHIRRANPRTERVPRVLRRGMSYGGERDPERGLLFLGLCARLGTQFEIVQSWINGGNITGTFSWDVDPLMGPGTDGIDPAPTFTFWSGEQVKALRIEQPLTRLRWGAYLFVPPLSAFAWIREQSMAATQVTPPKSYLRRVEQITGPGAERQQRLAIKRLLEEQPTARATSPHVWAEVEQRGGACPTAYGVLVQATEDVRHVLESADTFSVREYDRRMSSTTGRFYLGLDGSAHDQESAVANVFAAALSRADGESLARARARVRLAELVERGHPQRPGSSWVTVSASDLAVLVIADIAREWFGVRPNLPAPDFIGAVRATAMYIFYPHPEPDARERARRAGELLSRVCLQAVTEAQTSPRPGTLVSYLLEETPGARPADIARTLAGVLSGFVVPTLGSFSSVIATWNAEDRLPRLSAACRLEGAPARLDRLTRAVLAALEQSPVPATVYRHAEADTVLPSGCPVSEGQRVVLNLGAADDSSPEGLLFGHGSHRCPGKESGLGVILGLVGALVEQRGVRAGRSSLDVLVQTPLSPAHCEGEDYPAPS